MYSPLSNIDQNVTLTLSDLSLMKASTLTVSIVYLSILMIVGLVGNIFVLIIFYNRFSSTTHRCFILTLAFYDFFACAVGTPFTIAESFLAFNYYDEVSCKILRFVLYYTCIASSLTLTLIAIERSRKICTPLKPQFTVSTAKRALFVVAVVISSLSASPALVIYGNATIRTGYKNVTGTKCFIKDEFAESEWPIGFNLYLLFLAFLCTAIMSVCYIKIAKTVSKMGKVNISKRMKSSSSEKSNENSYGDELSKDELDSEMASDKSVGNNSCISRSESMPKPSSTKSLQSLNSDTKGSRMKLRDRSSKWANKVLKRLTSPNGQKTLRVTKMLTIVTVAFVLSYLPHLTLMIWSLLTSDEDDLPTDNIYQFTFYSFLVNNLVNPFIYAAMDLKFRRELKRILRCKMNTK